MNSLPPSLNRSSVPKKMIVGGTSLLRWWFGEMLRAELAHAVLLADRDGVEHRVEEDQQIRAAGDRGVFARSVEAWDGDGAGGDVPAGRAAGGDDSLRIDAELGRVGAEPADGALGVLDALVGRRAVAASDAVIRAGGDHAPLREIFRLGPELLDRSAPPAAAEEEHDGGTLVPGRPAFRQMDVHLQFALRRLLVDELLRARLGRRVLRGPGDCRLCVGRRTPNDPSARQRGHRQSQHAPDPGIPVFFHGRLLCMIA